MIIQLDKTKTHVLYQPEGVGELVKLDKFPGLLKQGSVFFTPNKPNVVYNLFTRLKKVFPRLKISADIQEVLQSDFKLKEIPADFKFHTIPEKHQEIALRYAYTYHNVGLLLEPGMGKTKVVLDFIYLMGFKFSLISCPKPLSFVWEEEVAKHRPELRIHVFETTDFDKEMQTAKEKNANVIVVNYDKVVDLAERFESLPIEFIGLDEGLIKNPSTERTKTFTKLGRMKTVLSRMVMSGTLVNNSPLDIFSPVRFLEQSLVGGSFATFRETYSVLKKQRTSEIRIVVGYRNVPEVRDILASTSIVMKKSEWLKLPPKHFHDIKVQMSDEQRRCYLELAENYVTKLPNDKLLEVDNPLSVLIKLAQISSGFVYTQDSEENDSILDLFSDTDKKPKSKAKRESFFFEEQPKIEALKKLLTGELSKERAVIWFNMEAESVLIEKALEELGFKYLTIKGGEKKIGNKVNEFNSNPEIKALVCQSRSVNYGVTILGSKREIDEDSDGVFPGFNTEVCNEIFYSLNFSLEVYLQQQDRIHRLGQKKDCHYWRIFTNAAIERKVAETIDFKQSCNAEILVDFIRSLETFVV